MFFLNSVLLGIGLATDAFSVSVSNGLREPQMAARKRLFMASVFGGFQTVMPLAGYAVIRAAVAVFQAIESVVPYIALVILAFLGIRTIVETVKGERTGEEARVSKKLIFLQGFATSIDALSVGFTIAELTWLLAIVEALIIGIVTFLLCFGATHIGSAAGKKFKKAAGIIGGVILIGVGIEIFITSLLGI